MSHDRRYVFLLHAAQRQVARWIDAHAGADAGVTATQAGVLLHLLKEDGSTSGGVAQAVGVAPPAMTGLADRMVRAGLVERRQDPKDARATRIFLTEAGRAAAHRALTLVGPLNERLRAGFTDEELGVVSRWLTHLREDLDR